MRTIEIGAVAARPAPVPETAVGAAEPASEAAPQQWDTSVWDAPGYGARVEATSFGISMSVGVIPEKMAFMPKPPAPRVPERPAGVAYADPQETVSDVARVTPDDIRRLNDPVAHGV